MPNWSGSYTITAGTVGTSTGGNTSTTFNNTGATWPTGGNRLANFTVRILSGTGSGQERVITSNTATQLVVPTWTTTPDNTSTYEIVLILRNNDHITASSIFSTNTITELEDNATIYVDGLYTLTLTTSCLVRWKKTYATMVSFEANNRTVQGKAGFWNYIAVSTTGATPEIEFLKIRDVSRGLIITPNSTQGNCSTIKYIWVEDATTGVVELTTGAPTTDITISNNFSIHNTSARIAIFGGTAYAGKQTFTKCWIEKGVSGGCSYKTNIDNQIVKECVFKDAWGDSRTNANSSINQYFQDNYVRPEVGDQAITIGQTSAADAGNHYLLRNILQTSRFAYGNFLGTGSLITRFNDMYSKTIPSFGSHNITAASYSVATSDNDYIAGMNGAANENVDTTAATASTANPAQYGTLTAARTNPKSTRNRLLEIDNVVIGAPTGDTVTITFDCKNSHTGTTVNSDSASGQPILNVVSETDFSVGEQVEIGYGTARYEKLEVLSLVAGQITFTTNLAFSHTAAQADTVKKVLRNWALPYIRYGTSSGLYTNSTEIPDESTWGLIWSEINKTWNGVTYEWKQTGHSVTINNLNPGTTYYFIASGQTPLEEVLISTEGTFTTTASTNYTDPGIANVRLGTAYKFNSPTNNRTGTVRVPTISDVKIGFVYDDSDSLTGTYDGSDRHTDPGIANVRLGISYKDNSLTNNRTGNVRVPVAGDVRLGIVYDTLDTITGTFGGNLDYHAKSTLSISTNNLLHGFLWLSQENSPITTSLGTASYTIYDDTDTPVAGLTESGIVANAEGVFIITPTSSIGLSAFTHYRIKIEIIHNSITRTSYMGFTLGE